MDANEDIVRTFKQLHVIHPLNTRPMTAHPIRSTRRSSTTCIFCHKMKSSLPWKEEIPDEIVQCGNVTEGTRCPSLFHLSCATAAQPIKNWNMQYLAQDKNLGYLSCPGHHCDICFSYGFMQSAAQGDIVQVEETVRAFHTECLPIGSLMLRSGRVSLPSFEDSVDGTHFPACSNCGNTSGILEKCRSCVHSFHLTCSGSVRYARAKPSEQCDRCYTGAQVGKKENLLVRLNSNFVAATAFGWEEVKHLNNEKMFGLIGYVAIEYTGKNRIQIVPINIVVLIPPTLAYPFFVALRKNYGTRAQTMVHVLSHLKERHEYRPQYQLPLPALQSQHNFHESFFKIDNKLSKNLEGIAMNDQAQRFLPSMEVHVSADKGRCIVAKKPIPARATLGEYIGEVISNEEKERRDAICNASGDKEELDYMFLSELIITRKNNGPKKSIPIAIDAGNHRSLLSLINSSCRPNCYTYIDKKETKFGNTSLAKLIIQTEVSVKTGEELTIDYGWDSTFMCLCRSSQCRSPPMELDWSL